MLDRTLRFGGDVTIAGQFIDGFAVEVASDATRRLVGREEQQIDSLRVDLWCVADSRAA